MIPTIERTPDNYKVTIFRLSDPDPDKIIFNDVIKAFYMAADIRLATTEEIWASGEIPVFDMNNINIRHFTKVVFSTLRLYMQYSQNCHPVRVHQVHIINCSSLLNRVMMLLKPFLKAEVAERIHTHLPNSETLFKYIPKDILPDEYNGSAGSIENLRQYWLEFLGPYRKYINNDDNWKLRD